LSKWNIEIGYSLSHRKLKSIARIFLQHDVAAPILKQSIRIIFATENTDIHGKITNGNHEEISEGIFLCFFEFFRVFRG